MATKRKPRKADIARLKKWLTRIDAVEAYLQQTSGDVVKGSLRAAAIQDAEALRNVLAYLDQLEDSHGD